MSFFNLTTQENKNHPLTHKNNGSSNSAPVRTNPERDPDENRFDDRSGIQMTPFSSQPEVSITPAPPDTNIQLKPPESEGPTDWTHHYRVPKGKLPADIAEQFGTTVEALKRANASKWHQWSAKLGGFNENEVILVPTPVDENSRNGHDGATDEKRPEEPRTRFVSAELATRENAQLFIKENPDILAQADYLVIQAPIHPAFVISIFDELGRGSRDNLAYAMLNRVSDGELSRFNDDLLIKMKQSMQAWFVSWDSKKYESHIARIDRLLDMEGDRNSELGEDEDFYPVHEGDSAYLKALKEKQYKTYHDKEFTIEGNSVWARNANFEVINDKGEVVANPTNDNVRIIPPGKYKITDIKFKYNEIPKKEDGSYEGKAGFKYRQAFAYIESEEAWVDVASNFGRQLKGEFLGVTRAKYVSQDESHKTVGDKYAVIRKKEGNQYNATKDIIEQGAFVIIKEEDGDYARVAAAKPKSGERMLTTVEDGWDEIELGWTAKSNLIDGWSDFRASTAMWKKGNFIGQDDVIESYDATNQILLTPGENFLNMVGAAKEEGIDLPINSGFREFKKQEELKVRHAGGEAGIHSPARPGRSHHQSGIAYDLGNADYVKSPYTYAKLPSEGMNATKKKVDKWLRNNAGNYGFVLPLAMTNERHHWEYLGIENTRNLNTYVTFDVSNIKDEEGNEAVKPQKNESFSLRRVNSNNKRPLYMKKESD